MDVSETASLSVDFHMLICSVGLKFRPFSLISPVLTLTFAIPLLFHLLSCRSFC